VKKVTKRPRPPRRRPIKQSVTPALSPSKKHIVFMSEVCARARISRVTLWRWIKAGKIKPPGVIGGRNVWTDDYIDDLLDNAPTRQCYSEVA
jgi:hypothetical protein